jgi:uncharacterized peroxidase-related enzyme
MSRIKPVDPASTEAKSQQLLDAVQSKLGTVPNIFKVMAQAPAALEGYLNFSGALANGVLSPALREQIALATAGVSQCDYCASAHTLMAKGAGVEEDELKRNLGAQSSDSKTQAALSFVKRVVEDRGVVTNDDLADLRSVGFSDAEIVEIIAHIGANIFTNYFNHIAETEIDFPLISTADVAKAA